MQVVFQDPYGSLSPRMSIAEIVSEGLGVHGLRDLEASQPSGAGLGPQFCGQQRRRRQRQHDAPPRLEMIAAVDERGLLQLTR